MVGGFSFSGVGRRLGAAPAGGPKARKGRSRGPEQKLGGIQDDKKQRAQRIEDPVSPTAPHRVAVIDHALASVLNVEAPELRGKAITVHDVGKRDRTVDHPLEARYKKLCTQIQSIRSCPAVAEAAQPSLAPLAASGVSHAP